MKYHVNVRKSWLSSSNHTEGYILFLRRGMRIQKRRTRREIVKKYGEKVRMVSLRIPMFAKSSTSPLIDNSEVSHSFHCIINLIYITTNQ